MINQEELRNRFNPDGSLLRRQQMRMLEMLLTFDQLCRKHDIPYWLSSGTLLGCVRHAGFIPWDDDLDVEMRREDYLRLQKVLRNELPDNLAIQSHDTDPNYFFSYPKLRDRRSHLEETNHYDRIFREQGIYIDIFILEPIPLWLHKLSCDTIGHVYKVMKNTSLSDAARLRQVNRWYQLNHRFLYPVFRVLSRCGSRAWLRHTFGVPYHGPRRVADIFPLTTAQFEGHALPVPGNCDAYLTRMFGDYLRLPRLDDIHVHVDKLSIED